MENVNFLYELLGKNILSVILIISLPLVFVLITGAYAAFAVIPFSEYFVPSGINLGLFYIFAVGSISALGIVMGGWASNNKYSLMGAMRSVSQLISYEIPAAMAILSIVVLASTM